MLVIKIGTNVLSLEDGSLDLKTIAGLVDQIATLKSKGHQVILVSSGAVGAGRQKVSSLGKSLNKVEKKQLWAAVGQPILLQLYQQFFDPYQMHVAQILATKEDFRDRQHYLHMRRCFEVLLGEDIIPIVNENDVIAIDELMFTDNDELASLVASMLSADRLCILTDVVGLFDGDPSSPESMIIRRVLPDDPPHRVFGSGQKSSFGRGGMATKYRMSRRLASTGIDVYLLPGKQTNVLIDIMNGLDIGTLFMGKEQVTSSIKKWIAYQDKSTSGTVVINKGAVEVLLRKGKAASLLPIGVQKIVAPFEKNDLIQVWNEDQKLIALGKAQYSSATLSKYLGERGHRPLIHYDFLVTAESHML